MTDTSTDPVEAVARALAQDGLRADEQPCSEPLFRKRVEAWKPRVRIAIRAYREALEAAGLHETVKVAIAQRLDLPNTDPRVADAMHGDLATTAIRAMLFAAPTPESDDV